MFVQTRQPQSLTLCARQFNPSSFEQLARQATLPSPNAADFLEAMPLNEP
jgi:hypothetical protein